MCNAVTAAICCMGNCVCKAINNCCKDTMKINPKLFSRIGFILLSLFGVGISLIVLFFAASIFKPFRKWIHCPDATNDEDNFNCLGISSVYRMSFTLVILHVVIILLSFCGKRAAKVLNKDCWTFKFLLVFGVYISFFFVSNSFFSIYAQVAKYLSIIFLLYQVMVTISFAHIINLKLVEGLDRSNDNDGNGACKYQFCLWFLTFIFIGAAFYWVVMSYIDFSDNVLNIVFNTLNLAFSIAFTIISITNLVTRKRLLTSVYLFSFTTYLCWSALRNNPAGAVKDDKFSVLEIFIGLFYLFMALSFLGFYIKKAPQQVSMQRVEQSEEQQAINKSPLLEEDKPEGIFYNLI
jgi:hypothetical protein